MPYLRYGFDVSVPVGVFSEDLSAPDILVQANTNCPVKCYLANYDSFHISRFLIQKNLPINKHIISRLLQDVHVLKKPLQFEKICAKKSPLILPLFNKGI